MRPRQQSFDVIRRVVEYQNAFFVATLNIPDALQREAVMRAEVDDARRAVCHDPSREGRLVE